MQGKPQTSALLHWNKNDWEVVRAINFLLVSVRFEFWLNLTSGLYSHFTLSWNTVFVKLKQDQQKDKINKEEKKFQVSDSCYASPFYNIIIILQIMTLLKSIG